MTNGKKRLISAVLVAATLIGIFACCGVALSVNNTLFKNNTPTYVKLGASAIGQITSKDDYEAYIMEVPANGALTICLQHENYTDPAKSGWFVTLYKLTDTSKKTEKSQKELSYYESAWTDVTSDWDPIGVTKGTYCVVVAPGLYFMKSEFTLKTSFVKSDAYEKEPNDTKATATAIPVGYGKNGLSSNRKSSDDVDWYTFTLAQDSCVNISFNHPDGTFPVVGWKVTLYNSASQKITQFTSRLTDLIIRTGKLGLRKGKYHISVEAQNNTADEYTLLVGSEKAENFEFELNDTPAQAITLPKGTLMSGSLADRLLSLDKDYYKFTVTEKGYVNVVFTHELQDGDKNGWNVRIIKPLSNGKYYEIVRKVSKWNKDTLKINNLGLAPGDYYILIDGDSMAYNSSTYSVKWSFYANENFECEPNSTKLNCQTIDLKTRYTGAIISSDVTYDEDYYRFNLTSTKNVCVEFEHGYYSGSKVCWNISIIDEKGNVKTEITSALNESLVSTGIVKLPAGVYFVKIETGMYGSEVPYKFRLVG